MHEAQKTDPCKCTNPGTLALVCQSLLFSGVHAGTLLRATQRLGRSALTAGCRVNTMSKVAPSCACAPPARSSRTRSVSNEMIACRTRVTPKLSALISEPPALASNAQLVLRAIASLGRRRQAAQRAKYARISTIVAQTMARQESWARVAFTATVPQSA